MARELHDTLAHSLSAVTVQLEAIHALWSVNAESARAMLASALENARNGLTEARRAVKALRASPLEEEGLNVAIGNLARSAAARANLELDLNTVRTETDYAPIKSTSSIAWRRKRWRTSCGTRRPLACVWRWNARRAS